MYDYRKWNREKQAAALKERVARRFPLHSPPHVPAPDTYRIITGACYEHKPILAAPSRLKWFEQQLLDHLQKQSGPTRVTTGTWKTKAATGSSNFGKSIPSSTMETNGMLRNDRIMFVCS